MTPLRAALDATFAALPDRLATPGEGAACAAAIAEVYDAALRARFAAAAGSARLALVATGGWARRELAPYSDLDVLLLHDGDAAAARQVADALLYPLWDERLAVGFHVCEPREAALLAATDLPTATALLDARHIAGDAALAAELRAPPGDLVARLAAERRARHDRFGATVYLLEPNLKQGIGALRDLSTALWTAVAPSARQAGVLAAARDFLLRLRALVQLGARRRFDQLTFESQEAIAPRLYPGEAVAPAALMRDYYLHARGVAQVTDALLARALAPPAPRIVPIDDDFETVDGEIAPRDPRRFAAEPSAMVRMFRVAARTGARVHGPARELVAETVATRGLPGAEALLYAALVDVRDTGQCEQMQELGMLAAAMPEWAPCTARAQHDLYHAYTVDQHQLYALAMQKRLARGELADAYPLATALWREVTRPGPLLLATLLHDIGKPAGAGHAEKGAVLAGQIAARFAMPAEDIALVEMLVRQHLTMTQLSQRRDLSDPDVIARFAAKVGDDERLVQLYLLTVCDAAMTSPDNLTPWKAALLENLLVRTRAHFDVRGGGSPEVDREAAARAKVLQLVDDPGARGVLAAIDPRMFVQLTPRQAARAVQLATTEGVDLAVHAFPMRGHTEVSVVAPDAPGALAAIAGALTANRIEVLGAVLGSVALPAGKRVVDLFYVRDGKGCAIADADPRWARVRADLRELLAGGTGVGELIARRRPPSGLPERVTPGVPTEIRLHDESESATIVEVMTRDRPGVLHAVAQALADLGLDIQLAKIATDGEKVADVFYVTPIGDADLRARVVRQLAAAVSA